MEDQDQLKGEYETDGLYYKQQKMSKNGIFIKDVNIESRFKWDSRLNY